MRAFRLGAVGALALVAAALPASRAGAQVTWTSWTSASTGQTTGTASGTMGSTTVSYAGEVGSGTLVNNTGGFVWNETGTPLAYGGTGPTRTDFIQLLGGTGTGTNTLTFSSPVNNLFLAVVSLGQGGSAASFNFADAFTINSQGAGHWGGSATSLVQSGNTLTGAEGNGVLRFSGPVTSLSWTNPGYENYYGFTVGTSTVPEPSSIALLGSGLVGLVPLVRRRRR